MRVIFRTKSGGFIPLLLKQVKAIELLAMEFKIVLLGSGGVGKSAITVQFVNNYFQEDYDPTIIDSFRKQIMYDGITCLLDILDTAGEEEFSQMRDQYIRSGRGFMLIYSVSQRTTFEEIQTQFHDQILRVKDQDKFPMILIGNKCDLQNRQVNTTEGEQLAKQYGIPFFETSALSRINIDESFHAMVREMRKFDGNTQVAPKNVKKKKECIMS